jgi:hypothetical protein
MRELWALGARLERDGDRLILRAGSRPIPQPMVQQARNAKRELLTLLEPESLLRPSSQESHSPTSQKPVAVLAKPYPESRRNADDLLTPPVGGLSGGLRRNTDGLTVLGDPLMMPESEGLCGVCENGPESNLSVSDGVSREVPKTATPSQRLAVLGNDEDFCGAQDDSSPKTATPFCRDSLSHAVGQQNALDAESYETSGSATVGSTLDPICCECGLPITERPETFWGGERCHRACGEAAWRRERRSNASSIHIRARE